VATEVTIYETVNNVTVYEDVTDVSISEDVINITVDQATETTTVTISNDQGLQGPQGTIGLTGPEGPASTVPGPAGPSNVLDVGTVSGGTTASATITGTSPSQTLNLVLPKGDTGPTGNGISNITRTSGNGAAGTTDTFTITYTNGSTTTFQVYNGTNGTNGRGITSIVRSSGNGTAGTTDTYTINYTDSTTSTFNVVNGANGTNGQGVPAGGTANQVLSKIDGTSYNTQWATPAATGVTSVSATAPLSTGGSPITSTGTISISNIANADISTSAAIAQSKLATNTAAQWSAGTAYVIGDLVYNLGVTYRRKVAGAGAIAPALDTTNWAAQTAPAANLQTPNALALRDSSGNLLIGSGASIALGSGTSPSFGGGLSSAGNITVNDGGLITPTTITGSGDVNAAGSVLATNGNVSAGDDGATAFPTTTGAGNIRSVNQIITNSTASDSIKTSGGVTAASATLTTGFSTAGVVHNNTSGVLSSSLIVNADVAAGAAIDMTKISGTAKSVTLPSTQQLAQEFMADSGALDIQSRFVTNTSRTMGNNAYYVSYFVATKNITISSISLVVNTAATQAATVVNNKVQVGIFQPSNSGGTYSASTPTHNKCLAIATKTGTSTMGGFGTVGLETFTLGSSITLSAGQVYGVGFVAWATNGFTTGAVLMGYATGNNASGLAPYTCGSATTAISSTVSIAVNDVFAVSTGVSVVPWARLIT